MRLIKIGRSSSCDIVLNSENVSALHAELLLLDSGEIYITDKNSSNGTVVANKRIAPNNEVLVRRGDYILLADTELPWSRVPHITTPAGFKQIVNIGTNFRNDVQLTGDFCSRFHAMLKISKNGKKAYVFDNNSKNGVKVNGLKITPGKDFEVKRSDNIVCADQDVTEELKPYIPNPLGWLKPTGIVAAIAAVAAAAILLLPDIINGTSKKVDLKELKSAVAYVFVEYHYTAEVVDNPISSFWDGALDLSSLKEQSQGTAFFIDKEKLVLGTNRHIAVPWEYRSTEDNDAIRTVYEQVLKSMLNGVDVIDSYEDYILFCSSEIGRMLPDDYETDDMNGVIKALYRSSIKISGEADRYYIGLPGQSYTDFHNMEPCHFVAESGTPDKDVALLQMNKTDYQGVNACFDINNFYTQKPEQGAKLFSYAYPNGLSWGLDSKTQKLDPGFFEYSCSKQSARYEFEIQGEGVHGESGSPVFDKKGRLAGILYGGRNGVATFTICCQAQCLKELYDAEKAFL